jgi:hypothetical protein
MNDQDSCILVAVRASLISVVDAWKGAIHASPEGGTQELAIDTARQEQQALTDAQAVRLAQLGRRIEAHFGRPQDIEWCLVDDGFQSVQSRPITTLIPMWAGASRGKVPLNRAGNRFTNTALQMIAVTPSRTERAGRADLEKVQARGKTRTEAIRLLRRRIPTPSSQPLRRLIKAGSPIDALIIGFIDAMRAEGHAVESICR